MSKIIWTKIDEAPALATYSLLPIVNAFTKIANIDVVTKDISLASRILSKFPNILHDYQKVDDELLNLGKLVQEEHANIIKLPNISASVSQLIACISELQDHGYKIPDYPEDAKNDDEKKLQELYSSCLGSAVNPVLREGNSDRRVASAVKNFAKKKPHKLKNFKNNSKSYVAHMSSGDFYENEKSIIKSGTGKVKIELNGKLLKELSDVKDKEVLDATFMSVSSLRTFLQKTILEAKDQNILWSLHLKATMMKVSDPIIFGHAVEVFFKDLFDEFGEELKTIGYNSNLGIGDLYKKILNLPAVKIKEIKNCINNIYKKQPNIAMVDSSKGITNLHASNNVIIDASLPVVVRDGGQMWNSNNELEECVSVVPDRCYATMYKACIDDCKENGQFDVSSMGSVSNVGLMAQKAEEYGSHPTTFEIPENGIVKVLDSNNDLLMSFDVEKGDIWRLSRTKDIPIKDWVGLAIKRARLENVPAIFWLDKNREHDANIIKKVHEYIKVHDIQGLTIEIMEPKKAMKYSLNRIRNGENTISVTGNVLRDYLTDLFPILELGTSAKMLSVVPLLSGGGLFETGAGGSAPKHVEQFLKEGHLRWDSLGEFLALAESLRFISQKNDSKELSIITKALDCANNDYLDKNKSPSRKCGEYDNKSSHFFLAQYWADALCKQTESQEISKKFSSIAHELKSEESNILKQLKDFEGNPVDLGGYFKPDDEKASNAMRPSEIFNNIIKRI